LFKRIGIGQKKCGGWWWNGGRLGGWAAPLCEPQAEPYTHIYGFDLVPHECIGIENPFDFLPHRCKQQFGKSFHNQNQPQMKFCPENSTETAFAIRSQKKVFNF